MVEVLVALFVLAVGLLGLAMLQTTGLRLNTNSYARSQATFLAYDVIDRMRANRPAFSRGRYDVSDFTAYSGVWTSYQGCKGTGQSCNCDTNECNSDTLALYDLGRWYERQYDSGNPDRTLLPGAQAAYTASPTPRAATISRDPVNTNLVTVTMVWQEQDQQQGAIGMQLKTQTWQAEIRPWPVP